MSSNTVDTEFDRIEREIGIEAPADRVWQLISRPGWYIGDDQIGQQRLEADGDVTYVYHPVHGKFAIRTVDLDEPSYAAFRWHMDADDLSSAGTLVEFWITPAESGVVLRVVESGFASLPEPEADRRARFDDHTKGWQLELALARDHLTGADARA